MNLVKVNRETILQLLQMLNCKVYYRISKDLNSGILSILDGVKSVFRIKYTNFYQAKTFLNVVSDDILLIIDIVDSDVMEVFDCLGI